MSLTAAFAFGQSTVQFDNSASTLGTANDYLIRFATATTPGNVFGTANAAAVGTNFWVALYYKVGTVTSDSQLTSVALKGVQSTLRASTTGTPGVWNQQALATLDGVPFGAGTVSMQVKCWDVLSGATYDICYAAGKVCGKSAVFTYTAPGSSSDPVSSFYMVNFRGFTIDSVPEPGTFALAGLGAAAMLIFRRRK